MHFRFESALYLKIRSLKVVRKMHKTFGIGWAKTGTTTLGKCFEILGSDHQSQDLSLVHDLGKNDFLKILEVARRKETFEDWPWILFYKEFYAEFPGSKFVLTTRDPEKWILSYKNMLSNQGRASRQLNKIRTALYQLPFPNVSEEELIARYKRHNDEVISYFQNKPDSLLVINWEQGDGWDELCSFLDLDIPDQPFPHSNKGVYVKPLA